MPSTQEQPLSHALSLGSDSFQKEWSFLLACVSPAPPADLLSTRLAVPLDWKVLLSLAGDHGVSGLLALRLQGLNFQSVPPEARENLNARIRAQHLFSLSMTAELFHIIEDFCSATIDTVLVKGPLISLLAYGDPSLRGYGDLDLFVRHAQILAASQRMVALGFHPNVQESAIRAGKIPGEYVFKRPGTQRLVEIHTEHTFRYYPRPMPIDALFARRRALLLDGRSVPALCLEDDLLMHCIHGAKDFWARLMWVADVASLVARHPEIDWERLFQYAREVNAERMLLVGLQLGAVLLAVHLPQSVSARVEKDPVVATLCRQIARWLPAAGYAQPSLPERALYRARMGGGGLAGALYLSRLSLSPTEEDWAEGTPQHRFWLWDALRRPFRLIRKYGQDG